MLRATGSWLGRLCMTTSASLLLSWLLILPGAAEAGRDAPDPERVYRQLRREPAIHSRGEAVEVLDQASPDELWSSAKLSVDERIKAVLASERFDSLDSEIQEKLHAGMLEVRSAFWTRDLAKLSAAETGLGELCEGEAVVSAAESRVDGERIRVRVCDLASEIRLALALRRCMNAREEQHWGGTDSLECLLRGGPGD